MLAWDQTWPVAVALDARWIYWATRGASTETHFGEGAIWRVPRGGGQPEALVEHIHNVQALAVDDSGIYWTTCDWTRDGSSLSGIPLEGGEAREWVHPLQCPSSLTLDEGFIYFADNDQIGRVAR